MDQATLPRAIRACACCANTALLLAALCTLASLTLSDEPMRRVFALIAAFSLGLSLFLLLWVAAVRKQYSRNRHR